MKPPNAVAFKVNDFTSKLLILVIWKYKALVQDVDIKIIGGQTRRDIKLYCPI